MQFSRDTYQQIFWNANAFRRPIRDPRAATKLSFGFTVLLGLLLIAYTIYAFAVFAARESVTTYSKIRMDQVPPLKISLRTKCTVDYICTPGCTTPNATCTTDELLTVTQEYTSDPPAGRCA